VSFWAVAATGLLAPATNAAASPLSRVCQLQFRFSASLIAAVHGLRRRPAGDAGISRFGVTGVVGRWCSRLWLWCGRAACSSLRTGLACYLRVTRRKAAPLAWSREWPVRHYPTCSRKRQHAGRFQRGADRRFVVCGTP